MAPLFRSFWQAGFECSTHVLKTGGRLDLVASTRHDLFAEQDFQRLSALGMLTAREGLRWHLIEPQPGQYDFSTVLPILNAAERNGIEIIWDLFHFGWPAFLNIFEPSWVDSFGEFASAFGRFLETETTGPAFVAPVNEISLCLVGRGGRGLFESIRKRPRRRIKETACAGRHPVHRCNSRRSPESAARFARARNSHCGRPQTP